MSYEVWGNVETHDLVEGGGSIPVTNDNVHEYIAKYVEWTLMGSVQKQYEAFEKGTL